MASSKAVAPKAPVAAKRPSVVERIAVLGIDGIASALSNGEGITAIARRAGVQASDVSDWLAQDPIRSARAREARIHSSRVWDDKAQEVIEAATDPFALAKAKELAHHYRWRAAKMAPKDYGDKVETTLAGADGGPVAMSLQVSFVAPDGH